ncbi:hypothetical protein CGLO_03321 [Colletotrichum gloeosporioides Cg-14]|uniref:Uncharacterized protein n=1 Tax=Colletotrichum gloeosporioides (strain Cg-14) TaxID=1237896 RepID=T0KLZ9_COLGC|nr:hypothetical protein CGLO_03321 [Colletotrichum gloeosporioides Cg-14]
MNLKNLWHALPLTSGFFASTCPSEIHATIPESDGHWVSDRRSRSIHQIHSILETCPEVATLDLRFALIGCVGFPERWSLPLNPAGNTKYLSAIRDLSLDGYNFDDFESNYISLHGWDHTLQWITSGNAFKFLKWRLLPRDQRAKTNLELWLEAMDFSQLQSLSIRCDSCRDSSVDLIAKLLAPKLPSLQSLSVNGPEMLDFILAIPAGSLYQFTWIKPQYSEETLRLILEHHGSSLTGLEWRSAETLYRARPLLPMPILRDIGNLAPRLKALTIDLNRHNTSWPLDDMATLMKSIPGTLAHLTVYFEMASEYRRQKNDFDWDGRGEAIEEFAQPLLNSTTARELARFLQDHGGQSLEQVKFFAGDWERDWGEPLQFTDWLHQRRAWIHCDMGKRGEEVLCHGNDTVVPRVDQTAHQDEL